MILCNPNNPTSSALRASEVQTILDCCRETGSFLMIDETYVEFAPDIDAISSMSLIESYDNLMILRGVSKFYAAPGLRLGYGATSNRQFLQDLLLMQNPWSLNSLGAYAGEKMLQDQEYIRKTRDLILSEREKMCTQISRIDGLTVYPAYANFVLVKIEKEGVTSADVFEFLIKQGLMVRDCSSFKELGGNTSGSALWLRKIIRDCFKEYRISLHNVLHKNRDGVRVHTNIIPFFVRTSELPCIRMKLPVTVS